MKKIACRFSIICICILMAFSGGSVKASNDDFDILHDKNVVQSKAQLSEQDYSKEDVVTFTNWDEIPVKLTTGIYDFSLLPEEAYVEHAVSSSRNLNTPRYLQIDGENVVIFTSADKIIRGLRLELSNSAKLTLDNVNIQNEFSNSDFDNIYTRARFETIEALDNTANELVIKNQVTLFSSGSTPAVSVNQGTRLDILGDGYLDAKSGYSRPGITTRTSAVIGGDYGSLNGDITLRGKVNYNIVAIADGTGGAGIGSGENFVTDSSKAFGSILIQEDAYLNVISYGGTAIGLGYQYNGPFDSGTMKFITIEDNAYVNAETRGTNSAAIGTSRGGMMMPINITDDAYVIAVNGATYDPVKYKENFGFGNYRFASFGAAIGATTSLGQSDVDGDLDLINISGNPTIIAGGNQAGIATNHGNINITGGNISIFFSNVFGIGVESNGDTSNGNIGSVNISGKDTKIKMSGVRTVTQEMIDNSSAFEQEELGTKEDALGAGIGVEGSLRNPSDQAYVNISDATIEIEATDGAGIGTTKLGKLEGRLNIDINNADLKIKTTRAAGIGSGRQSLAEIDLKIKDSVVDVEATMGAAIGSGLYSNYKQDSDLQTIINIEDSVVNARSTSGAAIGTGTSAMNETIVSIKGGNTDAYSKDGAAIGGGRASDTYPTKGTQTHLDGGFVKAKSKYGAAIGGGADTVSKGVSDQTIRTKVSEGTLLITNKANVQAISGAHHSVIELEHDDDDIYYREAITAMLQEGSDPIINSITLHPELRYEEDKQLYVYNSNGDKLKNLTLPSGYGSYAQTTGGSDVKGHYATIVHDGFERQIVQVEDKDLEIEFREVGRHESKETFSPATDYEGISEVYIDDNTFVEVANLALYDGNGHTSGEVPNDKEQYSKGEEVVLLAPGNMFKSGHKFIGWLHEDEMYQPGDTITMDLSDVQFIAQWEEGDFGIPMTPLEPAKPVVPVIPVDPSEPDKGETLPETGVGSNAKIISSILGLGIVLSVYSNRKEQN